MSFILVLVYLFCTIIRPQDWAPMFLNWPIISWLAILTAVIVTFERLAAKETFMMRVPQNRFMFGLFFAILMSHISHGYIQGVIDSFNRFIVLFLLYFIILNALDEKWKMRAALWFVAIMVVALVFQGLYQIQHGIGWAGQEIFYDRGGDLVRITWIGIFNDPNDLALLFVVVIGILLPLVFGKVNFLVRIMNFAIVSFLGYGVFLTNSRGGFLSLMGTLFFFFLRLTNRIVLGSIVGGIFAVVATLFAPSRFNLLTASESSAYTRLDLWYEGLQMLRSRPLFGVGFDLFMDELPLTAHNSYLLAAAELGLVGLFFWIGLIYVSIKGLTIVYRNSDTYKNLAIGLQSSLIGFALAAFFLSRTYVILPYLLFAFCGAVIYLAQRENSLLDFKVSGKDYRNIALLTVGMLVVIYGFCKAGLR